MSMEAAEFARRHAAFARRFMAQGGRFPDDRGGALRAGALGAWGKWMQ